MTTLFFLRRRCTPAPFALWNKRNRMHNSRNSTCRQQIENQNSPQSDEFCVCYCFRVILFLQGEHLCGHVQLSWSKVGDFKWSHNQSQPIPGPCCYRLSFLKVLYKFSPKIITISFPNNFHPQGISDVSNINTHTNHLRGNPQLVVLSLTDMHVQGVSWNICA